MRAARCLVVALVALLAACAPRVASPPALDGGGPAGLADAYYRDRLARGHPVFRVETSRTLVVIEVRRAGSLARFGHDHVVASRDVSGYLAPDDGRADLRVPLDALVVDEPALRAQAGMDTVPSAEDIAGTRRNMLERVLESARHPDALVAVVDAGSGSGARHMRAAVTLHGATVPMDVLAHVEQGADEIRVTGTLQLDQSSFGIAPFSILGGAIAVQDRVTLRFRIHARRIGG